MRRPVVTECVWDTEADFGMERYSKTGISAEITS